MPPDSLLPHPPPHPPSFARPPNRPQGSRTRALVSIEQACESFAQGEDQAPPDPESAIFTTPQPPSVPAPKRL
eukprot:5201925-Pyramimonas_sp.AAC.1